MVFEPLTFYIGHMHIITVASLPTEPPRLYMPWSLFIAKSVQLFYLQCYYFFWMNLNEWITVLSCYTCFLLDSIHDGQYSYCVRSIITLSRVMHTAKHNIFITALFLLNLFYLSNPRLHCSKTNLILISSYCIKTAKYATNSHIHQKR